MLKLSVQEKKRMKIALSNKNLENAIKDSSRLISPGKFIS